MHTLPGSEPRSLSRLAAASLLVSALLLAAPAALCAAVPPYATYAVGGVELFVPTIGCGQNLLAVASTDAEAEAVAAALRLALGRPEGSGGAAVAVVPESPAETAVAAAHPGARVLAVNGLVPPGVAALFNREPGFAGPNCFDAALVASGLLSPAELRHVATSEMEQLLRMYFREVPRAQLAPGDVVVLDDFDHAAFYLGANLVFHKKSFLKGHLYRIALLPKLYEPEPNEWAPGPFDDPGPFDGTFNAAKMKVYRRSGAQPELGEVTAAERRQVALVLFMAEQLQAQAPRWAAGRELGYFSERLVENLLPDFRPMAGSRSPVVRACYAQLESIRDQLNQSIEVEHLSSPHAQAHAEEVLKRIWLPRNDYSRSVVGRLLELYGREAGPAAVERVLDAIAAAFDGQPLVAIKG